MVIAPILRGVVKGVSSTMGLVGEKYHDSKERKAALAKQERAVDSSDGQSIGGAEQLINPLQPGAETADDERIWALDEAAGTPLPSYEQTQLKQRPGIDRTISELVGDVISLRDDEVTEDQNRPTHLPYPIIIPQKRPGTKGRGFAHAYPPDLEAFGIDQDAFLQFIKNFEDASQASPWLRTVMLSAGIAGFIPGHITKAVAISVQVAAGTAIELQTRYKANVFLDQINRELFMPMGLYCMVLMSKEGTGTTQAPEFGVGTVNLDTAKQVSRWGLPKENSDDEMSLPKKNKILRPIRLVSGKTAELPLEIAPLIYPGLDDVRERPQIKRDESFKERMNRNKDFVADYFDRRARADYAGNNPNCTLTKAGQDVPEFTNRFADPNHPVNSGKVISLISGGKLAARPRDRASNLRRVGPDGRLLPKEKPQKPRGPIGMITHGVRKVLSPHILYLTIVNMPSKEELAQARQNLGFDETVMKEMMSQ